MAISIQQEIGVSEGNEKGQGIKISGIARIHPWQVRLRQSGCHTNCSLTTVITQQHMELIDTRRQVDSIPTRLHCYRICYMKICTA